MKLTIVGPGLMPIPPKGWGAVEILIWDMKCAYEELGHEVQIVNTQDADEILKQITKFNPDFVHIEYDNMIGVYPYIPYSKAITTHFAYLQSPDKMGGYNNILNAFKQYKPNVFALSKEIKDVYTNLGLSEDSIYVTPNGVNSSNFKVTTKPTFADRSIYLAKIDYRKRQYLFQGIESIYYAGNIDDDRFDKNKNYLGEWSKDTLYSDLTEYGNLILLSDGEAHPLVCMEALAAGLGVVVSEYAKANLDLSKDFITVIPEDKIGDIEYIESETVKNREYSVNNREEILEYSKQFEWKKVVQNYYIPFMETIIEKDKLSKMNTGFDFGEKNKSAHKLKNFGPIYYLNLDGQPERREYMEKQFEYWEIENYERISAYDGREDDLSDIIKGRYPDNMTSGEIGCVTSHLKAIKHWYETSDTPYAIIMEDDCSLETVKYWNFDWQDFIRRAPYAWDVIQLAIICTGDIVVPIHNRFVNDFSTACYVITRHHAEKLIKQHIRGNKYKLDNGVKPRAVADDLIYNSGVTYATPLLLYRISLGSSIHPEHVDAFHKNSYEGISNFWKTTGCQLPVEKITEYNPYYGRVTESSGTT
jgi:GR25 family glycosyltransferase involved in LPS biosynthesis